MQVNSRKSNKVVIIGAGFAGLAASSYLARDGFDVTIVEKLDVSGGRARQLKRDGFTFDIGPTFYWMPDIFERFFNDFGKSVKNYYEIIKLNPAYQVYFAPEQSLTIADNLNDIKKTFESVEAGSGEALQRFIDKSARNYEIAMDELVYQPGESLFEIVTPETITRLPSFFKSIQSDVNRCVKSPYLRKILQFPVLFLGAKPSNTPAFYNFMNYADFGLGTWHPRGGMYEVVRGMESLALSLGVKIEHNCDVLGFEMAGRSITGVETSRGIFKSDVLLSGADYHFTESLLPTEYRQYSPRFWDNRTMAPSALLFYVGFDTKLSKVAHHTFFFDTDFEDHARTIYDTKEWPSKPLFYASFPSITDRETAPPGHESGIFLIPIAPDIQDTPDIRERYFNLVIDRVEKMTGNSLKSHILFKESFSVNDFKSIYNSLKGNAYGLANILTQTHLLRPRIKSKKVNNLYFTGQLTLPGPGVPPSLISGKIASSLIQKHHA